MIKLLLLLAVTAHATETIQPCEYVKDIYAQILPQSKSATMFQDGDVCKIQYDPKDGVTVAFNDRKATRQALLTELGLLEDKIDAGTITNAEIRRVMKIVLILGRMSKAS